MIHLSPAQIQHTATTADEALLRLGLWREDYIGHYKLQQTILKTIHTIHHASMNSEIYKALLIYLFHFPRPPVWPC